MENFVVMIEEIVATVNSFLWDFALLFLLCGTGIFYTFSLKFIQVRKFKEGFKLLFGNFSLHGSNDGKGLSSFQALTTAIAAQVGTGNIAGAATAIAAGKLDITVPDGFGTLVEVERGRVFEEMESSVNGNTVKCVGNVNSLANSTKANEVYVNLRFSIGSLSTLTKGATEFQVHVTEKSFCNLDEQFDKGVKAWNVRY